MFSLLKKEIASFLSSLIGYVVILVFLISIGLFMWVFSTDYNVLENDYANFNSLFFIAPMFYLFLIPAVTMRSFAEEKNKGTIELLFTRPLTDLQIILAKYFAGLILVLFSLVPTLIYYFTVKSLAQPPVDIDTGGMWGSYIGLLFLGAGFVSIGIFASAVSDNQIIAFIISLFLCGFFFIGFDYAASFSLFGKVDNIIQQIGIKAHYLSMSRGVIDTRDLIYFITLIAFFIICTKTVLQSRKW
jgi:gliding motility-associated transport system permease protein